ncbi:GNAT family acetyltransferase [Endozoicomonas montiporae]|uniref:GNAT family acetyltransferase n=2 Tax=Endozoicomonas montiporae TaxID=1027273 RepID=A0A081N715_9GAMM|nr:GNAT family N-acetyltransferase [Endozoicomonas montiporae]AMO55950.1 GCN5-related N-acetyltransferase [Endozoicomonas montiporae CL-33]KEQ14238.1 GNAT family acetyltransferase [Endozoicomonas montiporae]
MSIQVVTVDYANNKQAEDLIHLLNHYAEDPIGGNQSLSQYTKDNLVSALATIPHAFSLLCYVDDQPAGFANCFEAFSTFKCKPLINIHDLAVSPEFRGRKIATMLLETIEHIAQEKGCCKVTLEVLEGNEPARKAYLKAGFSPYILNEQNGSAQFWEKEL